MKDRNVLDLLHGAVVPLVTLILVGAFWLGVTILPRRSAPPQRTPADRSRADSSSDLAPPYESALPHSRLADNRGGWLPPLSDQTRNVLNAVPLSSDSRVAGLGTGSGAGKPDTAVAMDGPMLVLPTERLPAVDAIANDGKAWPADASPRSTTADARPRSRGPAAPRPLPTVAPDAADRDQPPPSFAAGPPPRKVPADRKPRSPSPPSSDGAPAVLRSTPLAARAPASRSEQLELIAREADTHSRYAFQLASRGAVYAARAELIAAMRLVAQGLDGEERTTVHSRALAAGLTALKEAEDFAPSRSRLEGDLDLAAIVAGHRTPLLRDAPADGLTVLNAMQHYLTFSQEQLAVACGREVAGSMTLYGLGKLHAVLAGRQTEGIRAASPKAVVFYQASLLVNPRNYMASNDLGVLLAQAGRYREAQAALEHSAAICRQEENWQNLAKVYRQLGQGQRAQYAEQQVAAIRQEMSRRGQASPAASDLVQWVDPGAFAQPGRTPSAQPHPPAQSQPSPAVAPAKAATAVGTGQTKTSSARLPNALFEERK